MGTSADATTNKPADGVALAQVVALSGPAGFYYAPDTTPQPLASGSMLSAGGNLPHNNLQPFLTINWCICLYGIFPSRN
jgi:microcystin-dependent protein